MANMTDYEIRQELARLYDKRGSVELVAKDISLKGAIMPLEALTIEIYWSKIWEEAKKQEKNLDLIDRALLDYKDNKKLAQIREQIISEITQSGGQRKKLHKNELEPLDHDQPIEVRYLSRFGSENFHRCQRKVEELKIIHNKLHEIEMHLSGLAVSIQWIRIGTDGKEKKKIFIKTLLMIFTKNSILKTVPNLDHLGVLWQQIVPILDFLKNFASKEMKVLEDDPFSSDNNGLRGPSWVTDFLTRQQPFETNMSNSDIDAMKKISDELLTKCRGHLLIIDGRLLDAINELGRQTFLKGI